MSLLVMIGIVIAMWAVLAMIGGERAKGVQEAQQRVEAAHKPKDEAEDSEAIPVLGSPKATPAQAPQPRNRKAA